MSTNQVHTDTTSTTITTSPVVEGRGRPEARGRRHPRRGRRPVQEVLRRASAGAWTPTSASTTASGSSSSRPRARRRRSSSAPTSPPPHRARPRACTWSSPTSRPRATSSRPTVSRSARCSTPDRRAPSSSPTARERPGRRHGRRGASYGSFATFSDPDGNTWLLQEVTTRLPGRIDAADDVVRLGERPDAGADPRGDRPRRAREAHGGEYDEQWPAWYAAYMVAEQAGTELPERSHRATNPTHQPRINTTSSKEKQHDHPPLPRRPPPRRPSSSSPGSPTSGRAARSCSATAPTSTSRSTTEGPTGPTSPRAPSGTWERLHYDWSDPDRVVLTTTDSNAWGGALRPHLHLHQAARRHDRRGRGHRSARARTSRAGCSGSCSAPSASASWARRSRTASRPSRPATTARTQPEPRSRPDRARRAQARRARSGVEHPRPPR